MSSVSSNGFSGRGCAFGGFKGLHEGRITGRGEEGWKGGFRIILVVDVTWCRRSRSTAPVPKVLMMMCLCTAAPRPVGMPRPRPRMPPPGARPPLRCCRPHPRPGAAPPSRTSPAATWPSATEGTGSFVIKEEADIRGGGGRGWETRQKQEEESRTPANGRSLAVHHCLLLITNTSVKTGVGDGVGGSGGGRTRK